jgi:hypothetical protein
MCPHPFRRNSHRLEAKGRSRGIAPGGRVRSIGSVVRRSSSTMRSLDVMRRPRHGCVERIRATGRTRGASVHNGVDPHLQIAAPESNSSSADVVRQRSPRHDPSLTIARRALRRWRTEHWSRPRRLDASPSARSRCTRSRAPLQTLTDPNETPTRPRSRAVDTANGGGGSGNRGRGGGRAEDTRSVGKGRTVGARVLTAAKV